MSNPYQCVEIPLFAPMTVDNLMDCIEYHSYYNYEKQRMDMTDRERCNDLNAIRHHILDLRDYCGVKQGRIGPRRWMSGMSEFEFKYD
jgi:hypothetical protein